MTYDTRGTSATRNARISSLSDDALAVIEEDRIWLEAHPNSPFRLEQDPDKVAVRLFNLGAWRGGKWCADCGEAFPDDVPIYRRMVSQWTRVQGGRLVGSRRSRVAPVCEGCKCPGEWDLHWDQNAVCNLYDVLGSDPCMGCERAVYQSSLRARRWSYCSHDCRDKALREAHALRMAQRRFECAGCGEEYEPTRSDARYCSSRCRQAAYRVRQSP